MTQDREIMKPRNSLEAISDIFDPIRRIIGIPTRKALIMCKIMGGWSKNAPKLEGKVVE